MLCEYDYIKQSEIQLKLTRLPTVVRHLTFYLSLSFRHAVVLIWLVTALQVQANQTVSLAVTVVVKITLLVIAKLAQVVLQNLTNVIVVQKQVTLLVIAQSLKHLHPTLQWLIKPMRFCLL